ncbi:MAG: hypothetical protein ACKO0V_09475 [bacterium]
MWQKNGLKRLSGILAIVMGVITLSDARAIGQNAMVIRGMDDLAACSPGQLEELFRQGYVTGIPTGRVKAMALVNPGSPQARVASRASRLVFSGKVIADDASEARNIFFGMKMIKGVFRVEPSVRDGQPAIILDYSGTSLVYRNFRDEIRELAPGLYLGYMMDVRDSSVVRRWFAFESGL